MSRHSIRFPGRLVLSPRPKKNDIGIHPLFCTHSAHSVACRRNSSFLSRERGVWGAQRQSHFQIKPLIDRILPIHRQIDGLSDEATGHQPGLDLALLSTIYWLGLSLEQSVNSASNLIEG
jgi:hypothetical protein